MKNFMPRVGVEPTPVVKKDIGITFCRRIDRATEDLTNVAYDLNPYSETGRIT